MLTRPGLSNDPLLSHLSGQKCLAKRIVDFMRSGMSQVFPLEVDLRPP